MPGFNAALQILCNMRDSYCSQKSLFVKWNNNRKGKIYYYSKVVNLLLT